MIVESCGHAPGCDLCGTDNVEARATDGAAMACTQTGTTFGRFVHVEQSKALRAAYGPVVAAATSVF